MPGVYKKTTRKALLLGFLGAAAIIIVSLTWLAARAYRPAALKDRIAGLLSDQLESDVTLDSLEGRFFPRIALSGGGLVVRGKGRTDVPPLLTIKHFEIRGSLRALMKRPRHVSEVRLEGLEVNIPPGDGRDTTEGRVTDPDAAEDEDALHEVVVDRFEAPNTILTLIPKNPDKPPKIFSIHHLVMESVARGHVIPYIAVLTNPVPKGDIEASGTFGPWNVAHPARTPVTGKYTFANADLNTIDGLSGILSSQGAFDGQINRIRVQGATDTPKFQIDVGGQPVPLKTQFTAIVDGSNGDTTLDRVDARFLTTELTAKGAVVGIQGVHGRRVELDISMGKGRIEDVLRLAIDSAEPILRGGIQLHASLVIPPEKAKVLDRMSLRGSFGLLQARFTDSSVQTKIAGLSRHGRGIDNAEPAGDVGDVVSNLRGRFVIEHARATFPELTFAVPGALVDLGGRYGLRSGDLDFHGHLRMQATLSEAAGGGVKSFFLKAVDPFFRKAGAGAVLPIKIAGTRKDPKVGLELFGKNSKK
jgi:hypothetical protein